MAKVMNCFYKSGYKEEEAMASHVFLWNNADIIDNPTTLLF